MEEKCPKACPHWRLYSPFSATVAVFGDSVDRALRRCLNIDSDGADVTSGGRLFQKVAPKTGKVRLPTVLERLNSGTASWLVEVDWSRSLPMWHVGDMGEV